MKHIYKLALVLLLFPVYGEAHSQKNNRGAPHSGYRYARRTEISPFSLSLKAGLTQFFGELNEQDMKGAVGIGLSYNISRSFSLGLDYMAGKFGGQKEELFNSYFVNEYNTVELLGKWNLTKQFSNRKSDEFDVHIYGGIGLMMFTANAYDLTTGELLRFSNSKFSKRNQLFLRWGNPGGKAGIKKTNEGILPIGATFDYNFSDRWKLGMDYRFYFIRTDKADATSGQRLINPEEEDSYSDTPNDKFSLFSFTISHFFIKSHRR